MMYIYGSCRLYKYYERNDFSVKKFFGVVIAVVLCICMMAPAAFAASETDAIVDGLTGLIGSFASGDTERILGELNLGELDFGELLGSFIEDEIAADEADPQVKFEQAIQGVQEDMSKKGLDLSWLTTILGEEVDADAITSVFANFDAANLPDLLTVISEAIGTAGIDMANFDASALGNFDIEALLGGADSSVTSDLATDASTDNSMFTTDLVTGIMDGLKGGLTMLGVDADALLSSMSDNEIINFFANMYLGFLGDVEETTTKAPETPDTGDTASVTVALATLCVAVAAAGVCLKKKED